MQHILWRIEPGNLGFSPRFPMSSFPRPLGDWVCSVLVSLPLLNEGDKGKRWGPALTEQTVKVAWTAQKLCSRDDIMEICLTSEQVTSHLACFKLLELMLSTMSAFLLSEELFSTESFSFRKQECEEQSSSQEEICMCCNCRSLLYAGTIPVLSRWFWGIFVSDFWVTYFQACGINPWSLSALKNKVPLAF